MIERGVVERLRSTRRVIAAAGLVLAAPVLAEPSLPIIPRPLHVVATEGAGVPIAVGTPIIVPAGDVEAAEVAGQFADLVQRTTSFHLGTVRSTGTGNTAIVLARRIGGGPEAYTIDIGPHRVTITASTRAGLFYGAVTLWQMLGTGPTATLAPVHIDDAPRYPWRGLLLDSARHCQSPAFIERMIDWMALHKLNTLQWHLTDDQGWRLEIRRYPRLTSIGAWRATPAGRYGGFYSQAEVRRIVAYAAARNITIVPEIEMPGHALAAILAYPKVGFAGVPASAQGDWGIFPSIYNVDEPTFQFLENILAEVITLFPSRVIAIGGDEANKTLWHASPPVQARMKALGITDETALQAWFTRRIDSYLVAHGRRAIGWDEILTGGDVPANTMVLSWHDSAVAALRSGHDVVMATDPTLYFNHRQSALPGEPAGRGNVITTEGVYRYDPGIAPSGAHGQVIGVQGQLWTEYMATDADVEAMALPRAAALAEIGWTAVANRDWADFAARLPVQRARYKALGLNLTPNAFTPAASTSPSNRRVSQQLRTCSNKLVLNLEGAAAPGKAAPVMLVDIMDRCWIYPDAALDGVTTIAAGVAALPFNYQLGDDAKGIVLRPPTTAGGELVMRRDGCDGPVIATMSLADVRQDASVAALTARIPAQQGRHDLCIYATAASPAPLWALDSIALETRP